MAEPIFAGTAQRASDAGPIIARALIAVPTIAVGLAAAWATLAALSSLWTLLRDVLALQFTDAANVLPLLDTSGRVLLAAAGYFALLAALRALAHSLRANGWQRLRALWAMIGMLPAAWLFAAGAGLVSGAAPLSAIPTDLWRGLMLFLLLQVVALAVVTTQSSARGIFGAIASRSPHDTRDSWRRSQAAADPSRAQTRFPVVRFGPPKGSQVPDDSEGPEARVSGLAVLSSAASLPETAPDATPTPTD